MELREKKIRFLRLLKEVLVKIKEVLKYRGDKVEIFVFYWMIMVMFDENGKMKVGDLSKKIGFLNSIVLGILDKLED